MCNSVFTPYYSETVLYSMSELCVENEDGISILFYLQKIYPGTVAMPNYEFLICKFYNILSVAMFLDLSAEVLLMLL